MEDFHHHCTDIRPNITYVAVGAAYSEFGGAQQHPPFLDKMINRYPNFNYQIIIIDPLVENPPDIAKHYVAKRLDDNWFGYNNLNIHTIRENFDFDCFTADKQNSPSRKFLCSTINRTIAAKYEMPENTYLLFFHDFSGNRIFQFSEIVTEFYGNIDPTAYHIYKKNIMIDVNNRLDAGCFPDINGIYFSPHLVKNSFGSYEIFNPYNLENDEVATILLCKFKNQHIKNITINSIINKLNYFANNTLTKYRQLRIFISDKISQVENITTGFGLLKDINMNDLVQCSPLNLLARINKNLERELKKIITFLDFFSKSNIFAPFMEFCDNLIVDPYKILNIFSQCQKQMYEMLENTKNYDYFLELSNYTVSYVNKNGKLPLFVEILLQDKEDEKSMVDAKNDVTAVIEI